MKIRLLPLFILMAIVMLGVRVSIIYDEGPRVIRNIAVSQSIAVAADKEEKEAVEEKVSTPVEENKTDTPSETAAKPAEPEDLDFTSFSDNELNVLQSLQERRKQLEDRARALDQREALLNAFAEKVDAKVEEMRQIEIRVSTAREEIKKLVGDYTAQEDNKLQSVVSTYEKMKPKDAARIFNDLEPDIRLDILRSMKESKRAPIIAAMEPAKAQEVTKSLAEPRKLPPILRDVVDNALN